MAEYFASEERLREAILYKKEHLETLFRWLADQFALKKDRINRRWNGKQQSRSNRLKTN